MLAIEDISNKLTFDLLTSQVMSESRVTWATSVPILVFLCLSVLELGQMYATDSQTDVRSQTKASLNASALWGGDIIMVRVRLTDLLPTYYCVAMHRIGLPAVYSRKPRTVFVYSLKNDNFGKCRPI